MLSRKTLLWINRLVWTLLVGAVILLGSIVSLGRYFVPSIETHQQQIVAEFNRRTGLQISVGHLSGSWKRLSPSFVVDDFRLHDPRDPTHAVLKIAHAEIQLGIFRSIAGGTVAISRLRGSGVQVALEEVELGRWRLSGFGGGEGAVQLDRLIDFLAAIYRAELTDSTVDLKFIGGGEARLLGQTLRLQRAGEFRRLNLDVHFADATASQNNTEPLRVVVEAHGDPRERNKFSGKGFSEFRGVDLTPGLPAAKAFGINLQHGRVDGAVWLDWRADGVVELRGKVGIPQLDLSGLGNLRLAPLKNIATEFLIRNEKGKRQFWMPELRGSWHDVALSFAHLSASIDAAQPQRMTLALPELSLSPLLEAALAETNLPAGARNVLVELSPQGALRNVRVDLPLLREQLTSLRLRALLHEVAVQPWHGAPGAAHVSGYIDSGLRDGRVELSSEQFALEFPHIYREPLRFDRVEGQVDWRIESDRVRVDSGTINAVSDAGSATAQFALDLPFAHADTPLMTLQIGLRNSAAQYRDRFIPSILSPTLLQWLQRSIIAGEVPIGGFIYRGSLRARDYLNNTVQLFLQTAKGELAYQPEWPPLRDIHADVWIDDADLRVDAKRARLYQRVSLRDSEVTLQHEGDVSWLTVDAQAEADNDDILRVLRESPIRQQLGSALDHWRWRGPTQSHVQLGIALSGERPQQVAVESRLNGGELTLLDQNIVLEDVRGELTYRSAPADKDAIGGLSAQAVKAQWFGKPVAIDVATARDGSIGVSANGRIAMIDLQQWLQQPLFGYASGEVPFHSTLRIANGETTLHVESDLQGASIELPPPYHKTAEQNLPLQLTMALHGEPQLTATLGDWADMQLRWSRTDTDRMQLAAGVVRLGQQGKAALRDGQLVITGAVAATDLSEWQKTLRAQPTSAASAPSTTDQLAVHIRELQFDTAHIGGHQLDQLRVSGRRDSAAWSVQLRADQVAGVLTLPDDSRQPWRAQLNYLRLPAAKEASTTVEPARADDSLIANADPRQVSAIDLHIEHLYRGDEDMGWVETAIRPLDNGMQLDNLRGQLRGVRIEASAQQPARLRWTRDGDADRSEFSGRLAVDDVAQALQRWRYEPVLTSKQGQVDVALQWPGRPDQFKFVQTEGGATLQFEDGQFTRASNSATGALKVVGIFNFANFLRRLQLDFSDVYKEGLSFDDMRGSFEITNGLLSMDEPIDIKSPSSRFRLSGQIDFNNDQTDMELAATLPVASNLPWVAVLTGALPAAAGLYVASKVFENQFDKFSSATYAVTGPWSDPQVKLRRVFDDQLPKKSDPLKSESAPARTDAPNTDMSVPNVENAP